MEPSEIGATHGSRIKKRTSHLPRKSASSAVARILASTTTKNWDTTVMTMVFRSESQNVLLSTIRRKFSSPTNCASRPATVAFDTL